MRSELVYKAALSVDNRFLLCRMVALSTKSLHVPNTAVQDTINNVLRKVDGKTPESFVRLPTVVAEPAPSEPPILLVLPETAA